jgi:ribosomal 30S subunit maturation factor RimM
MNWKEKYARKAIQWLLRYVPEWMVIHKRKWGRNKKRLEDLRGDNAVIRRTALETAVLAEEIVKENMLLKAENQRLREEAEAIAGIDLVAENARLRAEAEGAADAYNALLEEMEGQL